MYTLRVLIHHHDISVMELGHLFTRSGLTYPEVFSKVCHDSFCQLGNSVSLPWVIYYEAFYLHVVSSFSCIPVIRPKLALFLIPLQFLYIFVVSITVGANVVCLYVLLCMKTDNAVANYCKTDRRNCFTRVR